MQRVPGLLVALAITAGCPQAEPPQAPADGDPIVHAAEEDPRPDLILVVLCSLRRDHLGFAGYARPTSPFLDSLAEQGVSFELAMSAASWTKPATATILSGLTPNVHGLTDYYTSAEIQGIGFSPKRVLAEGIETLPEMLRAAGYATLGRNNNVHAGAAFQMDQGFDDSRNAAGDDTPEMLRDLDRWLGTLQAGQPFFFFLLSRDAHVTYAPRYEWYRRFARAPVIPEEGFQAYAEELHPRIKALVEAGEEVPADLRRQWIDLYDAELAQLDAALAELPAILARHGRQGRTVLVVSADHGERFFDPHGAISHGGGFLEEALVHVPLVFHGRGVPAGARVPDLVRSIDILPSLAELAETEPPDVAQGRSLLPRLGDGSRPAPLSGFASHEGEHHVVRLGPHKLHRDPAGRESLYDVAADPQELDERSAADPDRARAMRSELDRWLAEERALRGLVERGEVHELAPDEIESLRELGYVE